MSEPITERPPYAELMADEDFEDQQTFLMEAMARALLQTPGSEDGWNQIDAVGQFIAFAMRAAGEANKRDVLERILEVISYYDRDIRFIGTTRG